MTATLETIAAPTTSNDTLAEAFAELAGLISAHAHLPALNYVVCNPHPGRSSIDLWVAAPEDVTAWADDFGARVTERENHSASQAKSFTIYDAALPDRYIATLKVTHLRYHNEPAA